MNKKIKVIELLNLLAENKIEKGTRIKYNETIYIVDFPNLCGIYPEGGTTRAEDSLFAKLDICALDYDLEILEDEEEIDIQNIEELQTFSDSTVYDYNDIDRNRKVLNMLVKAVKKLDKNKVDYIQPYKEEQIKMKIKLIELLNMMANKEKLPKKILFADTVWYLLKTDDGCCVYSRTKDKRDWQEYLDNQYLIIKRLNENVLILDAFEKED